MINLNLNLKLSLTLSLFLFINFISFGCTWTTTGATTDWTDASAWTSSGGGCSGSTPSATSINTGDVVNINHPMELNTSAYNVKSGGTLNVNSTYTVNGELIFSNNSDVLINFGATLIVNGDLTNNNNSTGVLIFGDVIVDGNVTGGNGSEMGPGDGSGGTITATGSITTSGTGSIFGSMSDCTDAADPCITTGAMPLPVELLSFNASCSEQDVNLAWSSASEYNSSHYVIERSRDGQSWKNIGSVQAAGNSTSVLNYSLNDANVQNELVYYRLVQFDKDGEFKMYPAISLECGNDGNSGFVLAPNPYSVAYELNLKALSNLDGAFNLTFVNPQGKIMERRMIELSKGNNTLSIGGLNLEKGIYVVHISNDSFSFETSRFIVY